MVAPQYAVAIATDGATFALAVAVNTVPMILTTPEGVVLVDADGNPLVGDVIRLVDSGLTSPAPAAEMTEAIAALTAAGYLTVQNTYVSDLLANAQADALGLL